MRGKTRLAGVRLGLTYGAGLVLLCLTIAAFSSASLKSVAHDTPATPLAQ